MSPTTAIRWSLAAVVPMVAVLLPLAGSSSAASQRHHVAVNSANGSDPPNYWRNRHEVIDGDHVVWTFNGDGHSVTALDGSSFDSHPSCRMSAGSLLNPSTPENCSTSGTTFTIVFTEPGSYGYYCRIHDGTNGRARMTGEIIVNPKPQATTTTSAPPPTTQADTGSSGNETVTRTEIVYRDRPPAPAPAERDRSADDSGEVVDETPSTTEWRPPLRGFSSDEVRRRASTTSTTSLLALGSTAAASADAGETITRTASVAGGLLLLMTLAVFGEMRRRLRLAARAGYYINRR